MTLENLNQNVTLTGESKINDEVIATFNTRIPQDGVGSGISPQIRNKELYDENKSIVRADQAEFQQLAWDIEDRLTIDEEQK